jgi:hypothetical protein
MMNPKRSSDHSSEWIRKTVGSDSRAENPVRRIWKLRERMLHLGIEFEEEDERIRKTVGRPG